MNSIGSPDYINKRCWLVRNSNAQMLKRCRYCQRRWASCLTFQYFLSLPIISMLFFIVAYAFDVRWPDREIIYMVSGFTLATWIALGYLFNRSVDDHVESSYRLSITHKELAERTIEQAALYDIVRLVNSTLDLKKILDFAAKGTATAIGANAACITLLNGDEIWEQACFGNSMSNASSELNNLMKEVMRTVVMTGHPIVLEDINKDPRFAGFAQTDNFLRSFIMVPIQKQGVNVGALMVCNKEDGVFAKNDLRLARSIADQLGVAILNSQLYMDALDEKERSDTIINNAAEGIAVLDGQKMVVRVNKAWERITGWSAEDAIGQECSNLQRAQSLGGEDICYTSCCFDQLACGTDGVFDKEVNITRKDGQMKRVYASHAFINLANGERWCVIILNDMLSIEERKKEAALPVKNN